MFTEEQVESLILLGWAPQFDDDMRIVGFDKWVSDGDTALIPVGCGELVRYPSVEFNVALQLITRRKYAVLPKQARRFA